MTLSGLRLTLPPNCPGDNDNVSLCLASVLFFSVDHEEEAGWEGRRERRRDSGVVVLLCCRVVARPSGLSPLQLRESGEGGARTACVICFLRLPERNDATLSLARLIIEHLPYFV